MPFWRSADEQLPPRSADVTVAYPDSHHGRALSHRIHPNGPDVGYGLIRMDNKGSGGAGLGGDVFVPVTGSGKLLRSFLCGDVLSALARAAHLRGLGSVLTAAAALAMRRRFMPLPDRQGIGEFAVAALIREEGKSPTADRARRAEAVIRATLGETWLVDDPGPQRMGDVALSVMCGLVKIEQYSEASIDRLVAEAECWVRRASVRTSRTGWRRVVPWYPRPGGGSGAPLTTGTVADLPRTTAGQYLWYSFINDWATRATVQLRESVDSSRVIEAAFELALSARLPRGYSAYDFHVCACSVKRRAGSTVVPARDIEAAMRGYLGESSLLTKHLGDRRLGQILYLGIMSMCSDLGMSDDQVRRLLLEAERMAEESGYDLALA